MSNLLGIDIVLDGGHSGDAREVDERRSGPHQRERERATQGELVSVTRKEGDNPQHLKGLTRSCKRERECTKVATPHPAKGSVEG